MVLFYYLDDCLEIVYDRVCWNFCVVGFSFF